MSPKRSKSTRGIKIKNKVPLRRRGDSGTGGDGGSGSAVARLTANSESRQPPVRQEQRLRSWTLWHIGDPPLPGVLLSDRIFHHAEPRAPVVSTSPLAERTGANVCAIVEEALGAKH